LWGPGGQLYFISQPRPGRIPAKNAKEVTIRYCKSEVREAVLLKGEQSDENQLGKEGLSASFALVAVTVSSSHIWGFDKRSAFGA
jgi:hypothetical protein